MKHINLLDFNENTRSGFALFLVALFFYTIICYVFLAICGIGEWMLPSGNQK